MIRNLKITNLTRIFRFKPKIDTNVNRNFSDNIKEVYGLSKPLIVKSNPKNQMFYGRK